MTAQDLVNQGYYGYRGWGDAEAAADFAATHGAGKGGPTQSTASPAPTSSGGFNNTSDLVNTAQQLQQKQIEANQPAIRSFGSQIDVNNPNSIQARYKQVVDSITGQGSVAYNQTTQALSSQLGARGLQTTSPEGQTALAQGILPVTANTQSLVSQAGLAQQQDINSVQNAIAQLQGGNFQGNVSNALGLLGANLQQQQIQQQGSLALAQLAWNQLFGSAELANTRTGLGIQGGQLGLAQQEFAANPNNPNSIWYGANNPLNQILNPGAGAQSRPPLSSFNK